GPGSFTGIRVGVTVARTLAQGPSVVKCVGVPTAWVVAENALQLDWQYLAVLLSAKRGTVHSTLFEKTEGWLKQIGEANVCTPDELLAHAPGRLAITGDALGYVEMPQGGDFELLDESLHMPRPESLWRVGQRLASQGNYTAPAKLLPIYGRISEAERLWKIRHKNETSNP
ncbi:MAG TPA: tRNA (adenosine(37)-N6)-threonylcarbamoyltransferase complex dimerization subunit type 1 TsaB, partial [Phycisphaerae bacterium]|nr:tRNA (adenosine(37)-N6)-threonylcarbamoyltransferase complex dimerization subunit type 1 TsaB [Phycisphaerae bacterium]